jgi:hypothetical protein
MGDSAGPKGLLIIYSSMMSDFLRGSFPTFTNHPIGSLKPRVPPSTKWPTRPNVAR